MNKKLLSGSLSFGSIISRVLGVIYLIPWLMMMGTPQKIDTAQALFNTAYTPYALFISLAQLAFHQPLRDEYQHIIIRENFTKVSACFALPFV